MKNYVLALSIALGISSLALAAEPVTKGSKQATLEQAEAAWNPIEGEKLIALSAKGDYLRGEITYEVCRGCHRPDANGRVDGKYPRLAGQHDTVLIKQLTDIRAGRRGNPKMLPFADDHVINAQEIADLAKYLSHLPIPANNGKGEGAYLERAAKIYDADCAECHGKNGEGIREKFYPRVASQHFAYLENNMLAIRDGKRMNSYPKMVEVIKKYKDKDITLLADYMSRQQSEPQRDPQPR